MAKMVNDDIRHQKHHARIIFHWRKIKKHERATPAKIPTFAIKIQNAIGGMPSTSNAVMHEIKI